LQPVAAAMGAGVAEAVGSAVAERLRGNAAGFAGS